MKLFSAITMLIASVLVLDVESSTLRGQTAEMSRNNHVDGAAFKEKLNDFLDIQKEGSRALKAGAVSSCPSFLNNLKKSTYNIFCVNAMIEFICLVVNPTCTGPLDPGCDLLVGFLASSAFDFSYYGSKSNSVTVLNGAFIIPVGNGTANEYMIYNQVSAPFISKENITVFNELPILNTNSNPLGNNLCGMNKVKSVSMNMTYFQGVYNGTIQFN